ncbi:hypothetical protein P3W45_000136 [Vairimorpha bombi]|jgi:hypothetical protein
MSYILENWINKSLSLYLKNNQQDTSQHNVQILDILGYSRSLKHQKMILSDGQYFIPAYVESSCLVDKESFINIKKYFIDYYEGKFVLFVNDYVLIGGVSDVIKNPKDVNKKYSQYLDSKLYMRVDEYLLFGNSFTEDSIFENILVHENYEVAREKDQTKIKEENIKRTKTEKNVSNKSEMYTFKLNEDPENTVNIFSSSLILSTYENKSDLFVDKSVEDIYPYFDTHDLETGSVIGNTQAGTNTEELGSSFPLWSSDMSNMSFISQNTKATLKPNSFSINDNPSFLFISDKSFTDTPHIHKRSIKNRKNLILNKNISVDYRIKRGSFDLQVLKHNDQIRNIQKIFYKNTQFKYTTRNRNKYFNLENDTKLIYDSKDIDEYSFLDDKEDIMFDIYFDVYNA